MSDDVATRKLGPGSTAACAADADTLALDPEGAESVRVHGGEPTPSTQRSATVPIAPSERFVEQGEIGRGGMGSVHRVFDRAILRTVAEKRLHDSVRMLPGAAARFLEEAQITGQLDHPNIVPVHDIGVDDTGAVTSFSMKWVKGKTLKELVAQAHAEQLTGAHIEALLQVFLKLCDAVAFAHSRGVIHRDLKPDNVMVGSHGQVYLMDWGIARLAGGCRPSDLSVDCGALGGRGAAPAERSRAVIGTPAYMAPEQARGKLSEIDERTDVFGLGAILYRILTNRAPHAADSSEQAIEKSLRGEIEPPDRVAVGLRLPPGLCRITMKALALDPAQRFPSADGLKAAVSEFLRGGGWFRTLELRAGTVIVREGDSPDAAYIINSGRCEAYTLAGGARQTLRVMGPGEAFGETSIFADQPRAASVVALDDVEVMEITLDALEQECGQRSWMRTFVTALAERFLDVSRELAEVKKQRGH
ncbi:MAG: cyclic nucleotide-binding domain-containing protein [Polyangiaceae bacterium]|nr:cyclic nucleotide-binding domain-containing protein [Polyangiaceae bacterium]